MSACACPDHTLPCEREPEPGETVCQSCRLWQTRPLFASPPRADGRCDQMRWDTVERVALRIGESGRDLDDE